VLGDVIYCILGIVNVALGKQTVTKNLADTEANNLNELAIHITSSCTSPLKAEGDVKILDRLHGINTNFGMFILNSGFEALEKVI
jgi:hypothetical protein